MFESTRSGNNTTPVQPLEAAPLFPQVANVVNIGRLHPLRGSESISESSRRNPVGYDPSLQWYVRTAVRAVLYGSPGHVRVVKIKWLYSEPGSRSRGCGFLPRLANDPDRPNPGTAPGSFNGPSQIYGLSGRPFLSASFPPRRFTSDLDLPVREFLRTLSDTKLPGVAQSVCTSARKNACTLSREVRLVCRNRSPRPISLY